MYWPGLVQHVDFWFSLILRVFLSSHISLWVVLIIRNIHVTSVIYFCIVCMLYDRRGPVSAQTLSPIQLYYMYIEFFSSCLHVCKNKQNQHFSDSKDYEQDRPYISWLVSLSPTEPTRPICEGHWLSDVVPAQDERFWGHLLSLCGMCHL